MKRIISLFLSISFVFLLSFSGTAYAVNETDLTLFNGFVYGVKAGMTASDFDAIIKNDNTVISDKQLIGTGNVISFSEGIEYEIVVIGDTSGDGKINSTDFMQIRKQFLGIYNMNAAQLIAADINSDNKINSTDFMQLRKHFLGAFNIYDNYIIPNGESVMNNGTAWPDGQALPTFSTPANTIDAVRIAYYSNAEQLAITALQGIVNKTRPRIFLYDNNPDEGSTTWANTEIVGIENINELSLSNRYDLFSKYQSEVKGYVLYSDTSNIHLRNLASTVAATQDLIPVTQTVLNTLSNRGVKLEIKVDLTSLSFDSNADLYNYLYDTYWQACNHRLLISASPNDCQHVRDMAAATGSAVVYLDCTNAEEKAVFDKYLSDMTPGNGIVLGWFTTERSGITTVTSHGLSTIPADLYINSTFFAGTSNEIMISPVPNAPKLENKMYIALYISDGDNIQYNQRYMRKLWDQSANDRGKVAINWTISPALADAGPALMNYYYSTATEKDCFVCGPSGLGYSMPINTLSENGAPAANYLEGKDDLFKAFVNFTNTYLKKTGLRVVTVWDNLSESQRKIYADNADYLYGLTVHEWNKHDGSQTSVANDILIQQLTPCYSGNLDDIRHYFDIAMENYDGSSPAFFAAQASVWGSVKPADIVKFAEELERLYPDQIEFVRADHYYALYNEANDLPYDLSLSANVSATASSNSDAAMLTLDGTPYGNSIWTSETSGKASLTYNLNGIYDINRFVIRHAETNGLSAELNTVAFKVEVSNDGSNWNCVYEISDNSESVSDIDIGSTEASQVRIVIENGGNDGIARIADVEIYGTVK